MFGPDWLSNFFLFIFLFGLLFTIASLLLGFIGGLDGLHIGGHDASADIEMGGHDGAGHDGPAHDGAAHDGGHVGPSVLNMPTIMSFLTWFGGAGYLFRQSLGVGAFLAIPLALITGVVGGGIMFGLLARVLYPMMSKPMSSADYSKPGTPARVVSSIREGGVGEIVYTKRGSRFTSGARSMDASAIAKGAEVVIIKYERGIAYVQDVNKLLEGAGSVEEEARVG
jgi:hypothetical protein